MRETATLMLPLLLACSSSAGSGAPPTGSAAELASEIDDQPTAHPARASSALLYRARRDGAPTSYVLGTIHLGVAAEELPGAVWRSLQDSEVFVMETSLDSDFNQLPPPSRVADHLSPAERARLAALVGTERAQELEGLSTAVAYGAVLRDLVPARESMDQRLDRAAESFGLRRVFLEEARWQRDLARATFDAGEFLSLLEPDGTERAELAELIAAYRRGDLAAIERLALPPKDVRQNPERYAALFYDRNRRWLELLIPMLGRSRCFVAVGAGHLPGRQGVLRLLEDQGFEIEPVTSARSF